MRWASSLPPWCMATILVLGARGLRSSRWPLRRAIDALAVRYGDGASPARRAAIATRLPRLDRISVTFPPTLFDGLQSAPLGRRHRRRHRDRPGNRRVTIVAQLPCWSVGVPSCLRQIPARWKVASQWALGTPSTNICRFTKTARAMSLEPRSLPGAACVGPCRQSENRHPLAARADRCSEGWESCATIPWRPPSSTRSPTRPASASTAAGDRRGNQAALR